MYQIEAGKELDTLTLGKIINAFLLHEAPILQRYFDYYEGMQDIMKKIPSDVGKPCNHIVVNYCDNIVQNYLGYLAGIPISYENDDFDDVKEILNYNDTPNEDSTYLKQALLYGIGFEINYIDEDGKQRFKALDSRNCIPIYDDTINENLKYVVRFYKEKPLEPESKWYIVEVYSDTSMKKYRTLNGYTDFEFIEEVQNPFGQVPITVFKLNEECDSIFKKVMSLQDAYNDLISGEVDDFDAFADAYLLLKGVTADAEDLVKMKENRCLMIDETSDASYLTKNISDTQIENMLININDKIHKIAQSPDFTDEKFLAQSGIAMRYKLVGFENKASAIESNMRKALQRRIELICSILSLTTGEDKWRDVEIVFTRNLPTDITEIVNTVNQLRGIVSKETLLTQIPFVKDVDEELKRVNKENEEAMSLYSYGMDEMNE